MHNAELVFHAKLAGIHNGIRISNMWEWPSNILVTITGAKGTLEWVIVGKWLHCYLTEFGLVSKCLVHEYVNLYFTCEWTEHMDTALPSCWGEDFVALCKPQLDPSPLGIIHPQRVQHHDCEATSDNNPIIKFADDISLPQWRDGLQEWGAGRTISPAERQQN